MSLDEKNNLFIIGTISGGKPSGTFEIRPEPEEILDVDPEILAVMNARLRGESFDRVYGQEERVSKEFLIQLEKKKLARIFGSESQLKEAFSSLDKIKEVRQELSFEAVNREALADYIAKRSNGEAVDEVDAYASILFGAPLRAKKERLSAWSGNGSQLTPDLRTVFGLIEAPYRASHFDVLGVSKELLQLQKPLRDLLHGGRLLPAVDEILGEFYGVVL
jgi:hypothetical protein